MWCQTIADVFELETVPVEGEGAALGAAIHAAWVWGKETGGSTELANLTDTFVVFAEDRRCAPDPVAVKHHRVQRDLFAALSGRVRGLTAGEDPFALRAALAEMDDSA